MAQFYHAMRPASFILIRIYCSTEAQQAVLAKLALTIKRPVLALGTGAAFVLQTLAQEYFAGVPIKSLLKDGTSGCLVRKE